MDEKQKILTLDEWVTSSDACELLRCSYWHFIRKIQDKIPSAQPAGRYGQRFFRRDDVLTFRAKRELLEEAAK